ncbi:MAG TPA: YhdP family protein [Rhodanobacteraceae bacterium]|nr:YhdP family protein [Rhodanobacteraceae bacterium]
MTVWRRRLHRVRLAATWAVAVLIVAAGVVMGVVQLALPIAIQHPDFIARQLSARLDRPVSFRAIASRAEASGPLLTVRGLTLGPSRAGGQSITFPHAQLKFNFGAWLRPSHRWITLRLNGMELRVEHGKSGWDVVGFGSAPNRSHAPLQSLPVDLELTNLRVDIVDTVGHHAWQLRAPYVKAINVGDSIRFAGSVQQLGTRQAVAVSGRVDAAARNYDLHVATRSFDLAAAVRGLDLHGYDVRHGQGNFALWGRWRHGRLVATTARYAVRGLAVTAPGNRSLDLATWSGVVGATRVAGGWDLAWRGPGKARADIDAAGGVLVRLRGRARDWQVSAAAHGIDLTPWLAVVAMVPQAPPVFATWVAGAQPHVTLDSAALVWRDRQHYDATIRFSGLRAAPVAALPGVALEHATLRADPGAVVLELPPQAATLALTHVFRKPFVFDRLGGAIVAWREAGLWNIAADSLRFDTRGLAGTGQARLVWRGRGQAPFLSAYATLDHATVRSATLFWPYRSMPKSLVAWLDHALVGGQVTSGHVLVRGDLGHWPFTDHAGRFEATGVVKNAVFDFDKAWPSATEVDAQVDFVDNQMDIVASHAKARGITTTRAEASIPDLGHGVLGLDIQGNGSGAQLLDFVRHSPVGAGALDALDGLTVGGTGQFGIQLSIPLDHADDFTLGGKVVLARANVTNPKWNLQLANLNGPLLIQGKGFRATGLATTFRGAPATLSLAVGSDVADSADLVEASMDTAVSAQTLVTGYPSLDGLVAHASGVAPFHIGVTVAAGQNGGAAIPTLSVQSSLAGIALDFPAPLDKPAAAVLPLDLALRLPPDGAPLTVALGDVLQVRGRLADPVQHRPIALAINFGSAPPAAPPPSGLVVSGHTPRLDVSGWIQQALSSGSGDAFPQLTRADVTTDQAEVFGTALGALQFSYTAGATSDTIAVDGTAAKGEIELPTSALMVRGISANLQYLHWPEAPESKPSATPTPPSATSPIAPSAVPPLHVSVADLQLGAAHLGATTLVSVPTVQGMRIQQFDSKGTDFTIRAHGEWNGTRVSSTSHMVTTITSPDFGKALGAFGFGGLLAGGADAHVEIDGRWPGSPSGFSLAWMDGSLAVTTGEGRILAVKPGLGRLLGLLSLRELPNRLLLRFGDVFKSGFGFDHASAHFTLGDGSAYTSDMLIEAPAARITMRGRTGFRAHDFDLLVDVTPHVGGTLPVVGAVIGGPVGAAAGLVVQGLVGRGINRAAGNAYRVTGSWDKPTIANADSAPLRAAPAGAASTAGPAPTATTGLPAGVPGVPSSAGAAPAAAASSGGH